MIQQATDYLDLLEEDKRIFAAKSLVYISLGKKCQKMKYSMLTSTVKQEVMVNLWEIKNNLNISSV